MLFHLSVEQLALMTFISVIAGILNGISGGGGMVLVPSLLYFGVPFINAITITKFQNAIGSITAIRHYAKQGAGDYANIKKTLIYVSVGAIIGAFLVDKIADSPQLLAIIPYVLIIVSIYSVLPRSWLERVNFSSLSQPIKYIVWLLMGVYGGCISLATGPIMMSVHRALNHSDFRVSIAETRLFTLISTLVSLILLIGYGHLWWQEALLLTVGNYLGATIGAKMTTGRFEIVAKLIVFIVPLIIAIKLLMK